LFQKLPDNLPLRLREFEKAFQDSLFFNRCHRELESRIWGSLVARDFGHPFFHSNFITDTLKRIRLIVLSGTPVGRKSPRPRFTPLIHHLLAAGRDLAIRDESGLIP
jgi:hypothetical protein